MKTSTKLLLGAAHLCLGLSLPAQAQYANTQSVVAGFGGHATGGSLVHLGAGAQPGGVAVSYEGGSSAYSGGAINRAGFLGSLVLKPSLDTGGSGLPNELNPDNDGDSLWDHWEVSGDKFSPGTATDPNLADTDDDGSDDGDERTAGTDPTDGGSTFAILQLLRAGPNQELTWQARGNHERIYVVRAIDDSYDATPSTVIWSNTVAGGSAPWFDTTQSITNAPANARFFAVEVIEP